MSNITDGFNSMAGANTMRSRTKLAWTEFAKQSEERDKKTLIDSKAAETFLLNDPERLRELGLTETQVKNGSAQEQIAWSNAYMMSQAQKQILQQMAAHTATQTANTAFGNDVSQVYGRNTMNTLAQGNGPVNPPPVDARQIAAGLSPQAWQSPQAANLLHTLAQGENRRDPMEQYKNETERIRAEAYRKQVENTGNPIQPVEKPTVTVVTKDAAGNSISRHLTDAQFSARQAEQNAPLIQKLQRERSEHLGKIAAGDNRYGMANYYSRSDRISEIDSQLDGLGVKSDSTTQPQSSGIKTVMNQADYDAIKPGETYVDGQGNTRRKAGK